MSTRTPRPLSLNQTAEKRNLLVRPFVRGTSDRTMLGLRAPHITKRQFSRVIIIIAVLTIIFVFLATGRTIPTANAGAIWGVSLGFFSALLTALTIVFAVTTTPQTRWPTFGDLIAVIAVTSWLVAATCSILLAAAGQVFHSRGLTLAGAVLFVTQVGFGMDTLFVLMRFRSAAGRHAVLARLTTRRLHQVAATTSSATVAECRELEDFWQEIDYTIDRKDIAELAARVSEVADGWTRDSTPAQARKRLALLTHLLEQVGRSVLYESLPGDAARAAIPHLVEGSLRSSWRLASLTFPDRRNAAHEELSAAVILGQICRVIGWLQQSSHERLQARPDDAASRQILNAVTEGRQRIVCYVDPDPPGFFRAAQDPWPYGFNDPIATLVWLMTMCEFGGTYVGTGLYILCEVLTGTKFFGNYWNADCIFSEIEKRVGRCGERSKKLGGVLPDLAGDLANISLELSATVISGLRNRRYTPPEGLEEHPAFNLDPRYLRSQISMFTTYDCLPDAEAARAWLVEALSSAPTRPSLTRLTAVAFDRYCEPSRLPLRSLGERPAAVTLAAGMRLWHNNRREARALITSLPTPLIAGALEQGRFAFRTEDNGQPRVLTWGRDSERILGSRSEQEKELIEIMEGVLSID
jgi:hypothetical protein